MEIKLVITFKIMFDKAVIYISFFQVSNGLGYPFFDVTSRFTHIFFY